MASEPTAHIDLVLEPDDGSRLANLNGPFDANLRQLELRLGIEIRNRGNFYRLLGPEADIAKAQNLLEDLFDQAEEVVLTPELIHLCLLNLGDARGRVPVALDDTAEEVVVRTKRGVVRGRTPQQKSYLRAIASHDVSFGVGPAGTGKTYLAVASAIMALEKDRIRRIVLVRPAVEAGEKLGFLPGDLAQKVDPYLRPLYDGLYEMLGFEHVARLIEKNVIEVAPLAYMRGRTLNESFIILDEAQNTSTEQMKMFLTRIGFGSKCVVTGDTSQVDLPKGTDSGLVDAARVLARVPGIGFTHFTADDVVRHPLVARIVNAYDADRARAAREAGRA
jgi:phosphate starvation-inducible PhoH-like protein